MTLCEEPACSAEAHYGVTTWAKDHINMCEAHLRAVHASDDLAAAYPLDDVPLPSDLTWF